MTADLVIKRVGATGQISLGKEFAGRQVQVERIDDGRWVISEVQIIPKHELLFHTQEAKASAEESAVWLANNKPRAATAADFNALRELRRGGTQKGKSAKRKRAG